MQLYLFTGEEDVLLGEELIRRKKSFIDKYGIYGLFEFFPDERNNENIQDALMSGGMFATKKLVILRGIPGDSTTYNKVKQSDIDRCMKILEEVSKGQDPETICVCVSYKPDKRMKAFKRFQNNAQIKEFPRRKEKQFAAHIDEHMGDLLNTEQKARLTQACIDSYGHLVHEIEKIRFYMQYNTLKAITDKELHSVVWSTSISNNFDLLDHIYTDKEKSIALLNKAQEANGDHFQFLGMLYWSLKATIQMVNLFETGVNNKEFASILKIHPFVVNKQSKLLPLLQKNKIELYGLYNNIIQLDEQIKTGRYPAEGFRLRLKQMIYTMQIVH